jgi:hypothetical protein
VEVKTEEHMDMDRQEIMAMGEVLTTLGKYDLDLRRAAELLLMLNDAEAKGAEDDEDDEVMHRAVTGQPQRPALEDDRDEKGRRVMRRDRKWRENTLLHLPAGEKRTVDELVAAVGGVSRDAMLARIRVLKNEGVIHESVGGLWMRN